MTILTCDIDSLSDTSYYEDMRFLPTIKESIYSPSFYTSLLTRPLSLSLTYFLKFALLLTGVQILVIFNLLWNQVPAEAQKFVSSLADFYPAELTLEVVDGAVATNVSQPYFIPIPFDSAMEKKDTIVNVAVIDTYTPYSAAQFERYNAYVWVTRDTIFVRQKEAEVRAYDVRNFEGMSLNRKTIEEIVGKLDPLTKFLGPLLVVFVFAAYLSYYSMRLVYLLFVALIFFIIIKLFGRPLSFKNSYKMVIHGSTLAFLTALCIGFIQNATNFRGFPFMFTIITLAVVFVNTASIKIVPSKKITPQKKSR